MAERYAEHGDRQGKREIRPADDDERPANRLRALFADLAREPRAEDEVVDAAPAMSSRDRDDLHDEHGVEVAVGVVEGPVRDRECSR